MPVAWRIGVLAAGAGMYFLVRTSSAVLLVSSISQLICSVIYQSLLTFHCLCPTLPPFLFCLLVVCFVSLSKYCIPVLDSITGNLALVSALIQSTFLGNPGSYWTLYPFSTLMLLAFRL